MLLAGDGAPKVRLWPTTLMVYSTTRFRLTPPPPHHTHTHTRTQTTPPSAPLPHSPGRGRRLFPLQGSGERRRLARLTQRGQLLRRWARWGQTKRPQRVALLPSGR